MSENGMKSEVILHHFLHQHPLILTVADATGDNQQRCDVCRCDIFSGEAIYRCSHDKCSSDRITLHKECAEMPREISLSSHPQHSLIQKQLPYTSDVHTWDVPMLIPPSCAVCTLMIRGGKGYSCSSCNFYIHIGCAHSMDVMGEPSFTRHPSHPRHDLTLLRRPDALLMCDACGTAHRGNSYICTVCPYCINESCAALPAAFDCGHLHGHPLSLAYRLPLEYIKYRFRCDVCYKDLSPNNWVYHCGICRYVVHINCATTSSLIKDNVDVDPDVVVCPINDIAEEVIGPSVRKLGMTAISNADEFVKCKNEFHNPDHQLRIISSSPCHNQEEKEDEEEEDDDDLKYGFKSKLVCDGCTAPISSSSSEYISCGECEYFLHLACYLLPFGFSGHPLHPQPNHILTLQMCPKLNFVRCNICRFDTNGLVYCCKQCNFKVDIKCFCLPDTIRHAAHPRHNLNLLAQKTTRGIRRMCSACDDPTSGDVCYRCDVCDIILHSRCALLPAQVNNCRWDKHPLPLTYDASANHPSEFYCDLCEEEMNPKTWMYHCRGCDVSIHPKCLPTALGWCRNIKFGQRYVIGAFHKHDVGYSASFPRRARILSAWYRSITEFAERYDGMTLHQYPVAYLLTNKLRCSICGVRKVYGTHGFQCDSHKCDFFVCFDLCARYLQNQTDFT